ncbi:hypothetical protein DSO57_1036946 [Entomophthora muscae]|uniref:Uncharacterized protein n=1 Tax=Entomophthora muscae TaxID=34485 RepID=A0ACC2SZ76_9FUNG|nr:hypothetical protein DSO57_1036946 [Entomophthora muscae]
MIPPQVLKDQKYLHYFNTQSHMTQRQVGWIKCLTPYKLHIEYKSGKELITANILSRLYVVFITGDDRLDPDCIMLYLRPEATYYKGLNYMTVFKLKNNKSQFTTDAGNVCCRAETGEKTPYTPITQQGNIICDGNCRIVRSCSK